MKIDLVKGEAPDILLMNALSKHYSTEDLFDKLKIAGGDAEVKLTVNGFEVPFDSIVKNIFEHCENVHNEEVVRQALKLMNLAGMDEFHNAMRRARDEIEHHLEKTIRNINEPKKD